MIALTLIYVDAHAQTIQNLVGTWYAKPYGHSRSLSKATLYSKKMIFDSRESLFIDAGFHYTYKQWYSGDTLVNNGAIALQGDTLYFLQTRSSSKSVRQQDTIKLFLYFAGDSQLIYSYYQLPKQVNKQPGENVSDTAFSRADAGPEYKPGTNAFYKTIYQQLAKDTEATSVSGLLEFRIIIDTSGNMEPRSLEARNESSKQYLSPVSEALKKLEDNFTPGIQNAKKVRSYYSFQLNY